MRVNGQGQVQDGDQSSGGKEAGTCLQEDVPWRQNQGERNPGRKNSRRERLQHVQPGWLPNRGGRHSGRAVRGTLRGTDHGQDQRLHRPDRSQTGDSVHHRQHQETEEGQSRQACAAEKPFRLHRQPRHGKDHDSKAVRRHPGQSSGAPERPSGRGDTQGSCLAVCRRHCPQDRTGHQQGNGRNPVHR